MQKLDHIDLKILDLLQQNSRLKIKELAEKDSTSAFVSSQDIFDQELELEKAIAEKANLKKAADLAVETAEDALEIAHKALENARSAKQESKSLLLAESIAKKKHISHTPRCGSHSRAHCSGLGYMHPACHQ